MPEIPQRPEPPERFTIERLKETMQRAARVPAQRAAAEFVDSAIANSKNEILSDETVNGLISETNASDFDVDEYEVTDVSIDEEAETVLVSLNFTASGEQDPDEMIVGDSISGTATATIDAEGKVAYEIESAEINHPGESDDEE